MGMIGRWIDAQDDEVLGRLARVPEDKWRRQRPWEWPEDPGAGCIVAHAGGLVQCPEMTPFHKFMDLSFRFDRLCVRFGDARIGHLISERASRVLEERRMEAWRNRPKRVSEQEASVYFREHVTLPERQAVPC